MLTSSAPPQATTRALVDLAKAGDTHAFGQLYDRHVDAIYKYIYRRVGGNSYLAEDLTHDTFYKALKRIDTFDHQEGKNLASWLTTIARNNVADHWKSGWRRLEIVSEDIAREDCEDITQAVDNRLVDETIFSQMRELEPRQQLCLELRFIHGLSVKETAEILDINTGACKALQYRAIKRLTKLLEEAGWEPT